MAADVNVARRKVSVAGKQVLAAHTAVHAPVVRTDASGTCYVTNDDSPPTNGSPVSIVNADRSFSAGIFCGGTVLRA
jgi:hypothetical protein